ncbi:MAG: PAS domain-containing protein [Holophagaceae bacterium]|uniref:histidine kinase n=1 Tax=Candidatus Geothrix skivensis TaxID=2954439 RepID=A0A9D7SEF9_9BACT|nr:PAS domain-containing protein [Candidatus Geothrix skivensis]
MESDSSAATPSFHLLTVGVPAASLAALGQAFVAGKDGHPVCIDITGWTEAQLDTFVCGPLDALLLWSSQATAEWISRIRTFRSHHPSLPVLVRHSGKDPSQAEAFLREGFQETFILPTQFPEALRRARARLAAQRSQGLSSGTGPRTEETSYRFDGLFQNLYDWIYVVGVSEQGEMTFETVNPPLHAAGSFLNPDFAGRSPESCLSDSSAHQLIEHFRRVVREGTPLQFEEAHQVAGEIRTFQTILTPVRNKWGRIHRIAGISRDITALKVAQAELLASEERLNHALEGTQQGLWDLNLETGNMYRSPRWFGMLGYEPGAIGPTLEAGLDLIHPEDRLQTEAALNAHLEGRMPGIQTEYRLRTRTGDWLWVFDAGKVVAWRGDGQPARMAGMCTDISERRRAEESLRALVGGVVHEIRNPVYGISINLDALEATFGDEPRYHSFLVALRESAERIQSLMNDLRDYGEPRTLNPEPCRVRSLLEDAMRSCDALRAEKGCIVRQALEDEGLVLPLNARRMHQVFRNLIENALHHSPRAGTVSVWGRHLRDEGHDWWAFTVEDEGSGFEPESLARAFEPFFTRRKGGTGLGLSIVKRVVEEHGGSIEVQNGAEGGARVTLRLPAPRRRMELIGDSRA